LDLLDPHSRLEQGELAGPGSRSPGLSRHHVWLGEHDDVAAGTGLVVLPLSYLYPGYRSDALVHEYLLGTRGPMEQTTS
jgi:hypothetical protein